MATTGARTCHDDVGTTAETVTLTDSVKQVAVVNRHANQLLYVTVATGQTSAAAVARVVTAVAGADGTIVVPPGQRVVVEKSPRAFHAALSVIASGASTTYSVHGTGWFD